MAGLNTFKDEKFTTWSDNTTASISSKTDLFGKTRYSAENKFVPAVPRLQINSRAEPKSIVFQDLAVEDLQARLVRQTKDADRKTGLSTDDGAKIATASCAKVEGPIYRCLDGIQPPKQQKSGTDHLAEEYTHLKTKQVIGDLMQ